VQPGREDCGELVSISYSGEEGFEYHYYGPCGSGAASHDVYFGTSDAPPFQTNETASTFAPGLLCNRTIYYWRVDEVNSYGTTTGPVWKFRIISGWGD